MYDKIREIQGQKRTYKRKALNDNTDLTTTELYDPRPLYLDSTAAAVAVAGEIREIEATASATTIATDGNINSIVSTTAGATTTPAAVAATKKAKTANDANTALTTTELYDPRPLYLDYLYKENKPKKGPWKGRKKGLESCREARNMLINLNVPTGNPEDQLVFLKQKDKKTFYNWKVSDVEELLDMFQ